MNFRERAFAALVTSILEAPRIYVLAVLILVVIAFSVGFPLKVEGDILKLIPASDPATRAMMDFREGPGGQGVVALSVPTGTDIADLSVKLRALPTVRTTYHGLEGPLGLKIALLQLPAGELEKLANEFRFFIDEGGLGLLNLPEFPRRTFPGLLNAFKNLAPEEQQEPGSRILFVISTQPERDVRYSEQLLSDLESVVPQGTLIAGPHVQNARDTRALRKDIIRTSIASLFLVIVIVGIAFRHVAGMLILVPPLLAANVVTHSILQASMGAINMYTSMGSAVLFGLGIDFGIHLVSRYREELGQGLAPNEAVRSAWIKTGPPCLTAALTSTAAFLVFLVADFNGLRQLGLMLAIGVLLNLLMMVIILPVIVTRMRLPSLEVREYKFISLSRLPMVGLPVLIVSIAFAVKATDLGFEYDLGAIRGDGQAWSELSPAEKNNKEAGYPPVVLLVEDRTSQHNYFQRLVDSGELPHVRAVVSLDTVLPVDQKERLKALKKLVQVANHPERDELPTLYSEILEQIGALDTSLISAEDLPEGLSFLLGSSEPRVMLFLQGNMLDLREAYALSIELEPHFNGAVSGFLVAASIYKTLSRDLPRVAALALISVLLILAFDLRNFRIIFIGSLSLLLGLVWTAGSLVVFDIRINIINVVALPMLLGIGIDVIVHLLHRLRTGDSVSMTIRTTGMAVFLSTVTTIFAFLSLALAGNRGLQSMGFVVLIGLSAVFLSALLTLLVIDSASDGRVAPG